MWEDTTGEDKELRGKEGNKGIGERRRESKERRRKKRDSKEERMV